MLKRERRRKRFWPLT